VSNLVVEAQRHIIRQHGLQGWCLAESREGSEAVLAAQKKTSNKILESIDERGKKVCSPTSGIRMVIIRGQIRASAISVESLK
jgi:hypothetical protein